jgi:2-oxo-4-hydroxy-4-carboxy-5-ureidoimidazoline decarboxylase
MSVLERWNLLSVQGAIQEILACCGSDAWAHQLVARRPIPDESSLIAASEEIWGRLSTEDRLQAFCKHPRIGGRKATAEAPSTSATWSAHEQQSVAAAGESIQAALAQGNLEYEKRFGRVFIVCATGKSAAEMLEILSLRLRNDDAAELHEAAEEQRKITNIRLKKWLSQ